MPKLFFSDAVPVGRGYGFSLGSPHYSYSYPCSRIISLFRQGEPTYLQRPEIISSDVARRAIGVQSGQKPSHLIFRPFERIRVLKGAYNIVHVPWEFNHLIDAAPERNPHPFLAQRAMLGTCQEIWTGSGHAAEVYREHGVENVKVIPSPVPCPDNFPVRSGACAMLETFGQLPSLSLGISFGVNNIDRHQRAICPLAEQPAFQQIDGLRLYLTVFNPGDFRKNAEKMLRGFAEFAQDHPEAVLLVKLVIDNEKPTLGTAQQNTLLPKFKETSTLHSNRVIFISPFLEEAEMAKLYRLVDFYICLSIGEGQNLPLCESMAQGVVPISVAHTAMADYIDESVGIVVPSRRALILSPEASHYTVDGYVDAFECSELDYIEALERSAGLDAAALQVLRLAAYARAKSLFSDEAVRQCILDRAGYDFSEYL